MADHALLRAVADRGAIPAQRNQLQRFDWLLAALEVFVAEGIDAVRITRLANDLGVTRGSFYWHFADRDDLIDALVAYWRGKNTQAIVNAMKNAVSVSDGIFELFETCLDADLFDPRLDLAIREWARRSDVIRAAVDEADTTRVQSITDFFARFDYPMPQAFIRARVVYFAQIGFYALDVREPLATRLGYTEAYFESFTGQRPASEEADAFRKRVMERYGDKLP